MRADNIYRELTIFYKAAILAGVRWRAYDTIGPAPPFVRLIARLPRLIRRFLAKVRVPKNFPGVTAVTRMFQKIQIKFWSPKIS